MFIEFYDKSATRIWSRIKIVFLGIVSVSMAPVELLAGDFSNAQDRRAAAWILEALERDYSDSENDLSKLKSLVAEPADLDKVETAFTRLQACRTSPKYYNNPLPIVAAEHHLYIRYLANKNGDSKLSALPKTYYDAKVELQNQNRLNWLRTTDQPVSPPSESVVEWAVLGVQMGLAEYKLRTGDNPAPGEKADELVGMLEAGKALPIFSWGMQFFDPTKYSRSNGMNCAVSDPGDADDSLKLP
ncbi:hypothetical protein [Ruegeria arenilitoris]|uniref:hypothetical protein n=1 Tax=Ruegeria arenilitoris TaxID=1173585 RepID=UPI001479FFDF|nr:hypothetical protein [Ruegeria arenilitoris]